ncbi:Panacea domain-containing protein [Candidatus Phytoplasma pruni]|uniref:DUF4065 domain-containing protein n=1 Tax=Candidatus Phytoplasma pruni TaxID=479893 RepID=A0A851HHB5_9MOLU|nr:type II toxin-antitoxin system antitoxin SocA domain-containing protein [Candidatus Phytoplasma pruni]NWN45674.1 DUF4065 domain-containing protein [Candidatus Phytoplasma pruni]
MTNKPLNVLDVASYIVEYAKKNKITDLTNMKLQKLVYYSHAQYLIENNYNPLIDNPIEAWPYGPVIPDLYFYCRQFKYDPVESIEYENKKKLNENHIKVIDNVLNAYSSWTAKQLSEKTHSETPWQKAFQDDRDYSQNVITNQAIYSFYFKQYQKKMALNKK